MLKKSISGLLILTFFLSNLAYSAPLENAALPLKPIELISQDPLRFEPPLDFSFLKEVHQGGNDKLIIHIQDAHTNFSGQQNLANTLNDIFTKYGVSLVLVEGSSVEATLSPIKEAVPSGVRKKIAKTLMMEGQLAGEEYLNLVSDHPMKIMGVEDSELYQRSVESYSQLTDAREGILDYLKKIRGGIDKLKRKLYPQDILNYEKKSSSDGVINAKELIMLAKKSDVDLKDFANIQKLVALQEKESQINFDVANLEQAALVQEVISKAGNESFMHHLDEINRIKDSKPSHSAYFQKTFNMAQAKGVDTSKYRDLNAYAEYLKDFSAIDADALLSELLQAEDKTYVSLLKTGDARLLRSIDRYTRLLNTAYNIQMSTKEFNVFQANEADFSTLNMLAFINRKLSEAGYFADMLPYVDVLENGRAALVEFYDSVNKRDLAFIENTERILGEENQNVAVLISGGYHTEHLKTLFQQKDYSYVVLTPVVTTETNQSRYEKLLLSPVKKKLQTVETQVGESKSKKPNVLEKLLSIENKDNVRLASAVIRQNDPQGAVSRLLEHATPGRAQEAKAVLASRLAPLRTLATAALVSFAAVEAGAQIGSLPPKIQGSTVRYLEDYSGNLRPAFNPGPAHWNTVPASQDERIITTYSADVVYSPIALALTGQAARANAVTTQLAGGAGRPSGTGLFRTHIPVSNGPYIDPLTGASVSTFPSVKAEVDANAKILLSQLHVAHTLGQTDLLTSPQVQLAISIFNALNDPSVKVQYGLSHEAGTNEVRTVGNSLAYDGAKKLREIAQRNSAAHPAESQALIQQIDLFTAHIEDFFWNWAWNGANGFHDRGFIRDGIYIGQDQSVDSNLLPARTLLNNLGLSGIEAYLGSSALRQLWNLAAGTGGYTAEQGFNKTADQHDAFRFSHNYSEVLRGLSGAIRQDSAKFFQNIAADSFAELQDRVVVRSDGSTAVPYALLESTDVYGRQVHAVNSAEAATELLLTNFRHSDSQPGDQAGFDLLGPLGGRPLPQTPLDLKTGLPPNPYAFQTLVEGLRGQGLVLYFSPLNGKGEASTISLARSNIVNQITVKVTRDNNLTTLNEAYNLQTGQTYAYSFGLTASGSPQFPDNLLITETIGGIESVVGRYDVKIGQLYYANDNTNGNSIRYTFEPKAIHDQIRNEQGNRFNEDKPNTPITVRSIGESAKPTPSRLAEAEVPVFKTLFDAALITAQVRTGDDVKKLADSPAVALLARAFADNPQNPVLKDLIPYNFDQSNAAVRVEANDARTPFKGASINFYVKEKGVETLIGKIELPGDALEIAKKVNEQARETIPQELRTQSATLENFATIIQAFRLHSQYGQRNLTDVVSKAEIVLAVPAGSGRSAEELKFLSDLLVAFRPVLRNQFYLVFTDEQVLTDGALNLSTRTDIPPSDTLPVTTVPRQIIVLAAPNESTLTQLENRTGIFPIPEARATGEGLELANYAVALLLADLIAGLSKEETATLVRDDRFNRLIRIALGSKFVTEGLDTAQVVNAVILVQRNLIESGFYKKILFETLKPLNFSQIFDLQQMIIKAVGAAA